MQPHHSKSTQPTLFQHISMFIHIPFLTKMLAMSIMENELSKRVIVFPVQPNPTFIYIVAMCIVQKTHQVTPNHLSFHYFSACSYHRASIDTFIAWLPASVQLNYTVVQFDIFVKKL